MKSYVFRVAIEADKFEDGRDAWHAYCLALKGCDRGGTLMRRRLQISARPLISTFKTSSKRARQFPRIKAPSNWPNLLFSSTYDAGATGPVGWPFRPRFGK